MNPLAPSMYELLNAIWNDPKYVGVRDKAFEEYTKNCSNQLAILKGPEKLAPLLMQMAIAGFTEDDYDAMISALQPKVADKRRREKQNKMLAGADLQRMKLDAYKAQMEMYQKYLNGHQTVLQEKTSFLQKLMGTRS
jgi:hypothetical protein